MAAPAAAGAEGAAAAAGAAAEGGGAGTGAAAQAGAEAEGASAALLAALRKQIEYYFSDFNFRKDKFLRHKAAEDADGFVVLDVLLTFNKIKSLKVSDPKVLAAALEDSEELELSEDSTSVRRTRPLPEEDDSEARSVYAKGPFPSDATLEKLREWAAVAGEVGRLNMRKMNNKEKTFKGSVFIEYAKPEGTAAMLELFGKGGLAYEGAPVLKVEALKAYSARKKTERDERRAKKAAAGGGAGAGAGGTRKPAGAGGAAGAAGAPKRPHRDAAEKVEEEDEAAVMVPGKDGPRAFKKEMVPGTIMRVGDMGSHSSVDTRGKLQTFFNAMSDSKLKYVEYDPATRTAFARFSTAGELGAGWQQQQPGRARALAPFLFPPLLRPAYLATLSPQLHPSRTCHPLLQRPARPCWLPSRPAAPTSRRPRAQRRPWALCWRVRVWVSGISFAVQGHSCYRAASPPALHTQHNLPLTFPPCASPTLT